MTPSRYSDDTPSEPVVDNSVLARISGHTPESFARTFIAEVLRYASQHEDPVYSKTIEVEVDVTVSENERPSTDSEIVHLPIVTVDVHIPGTDHTIHVVWPPVFIFH